MTPNWNCHPPIELPSPTLSVLPGPNGVWAGGLGGVACFDDQRGWRPLLSGLPLTSVTALALGDGLLLAGGTGGIAFSTNLGETWSQPALPDGTATVTSLALSPAFAQDGTALAATLDDGILRSADAGRTWQPASFGLQSREVLALLWPRADTALAATRAGLHRSTNAGRAWRLCPGTDDTPYAALALLPDGSVLAAPETGPFVRSTGHLTDWSPLGILPDGVQPWSLLATDNALLLGTTDHGLLRSIDGGTTWSVVSHERVLTIASDNQHLYAGTDTGLSVSSDGGTTWTPLPPSPLHDLRRLLILDGAPLVFGTNSPPVIQEPDGTWTPLTTMPLPLTGLFPMPDRSLLASSPGGLFRSAARGASWHPLVDGNDGCVTHLTFLPDGTGWAGGVRNTPLLATQDTGRSWHRLSPPFGILPLVALQAIPATQHRPTPSLIAATYDDRRQTVTTWRSDDRGEHWLRGADSPTTWPLVATCSAPPLLTIGNLVTVQTPDGHWHKTPLGEIGIRRIVADDNILFALAEGLWHSTDHGATWTRDDLDLPIDHLLDVALDNDTVYAFLTGGRVWSKRT